MPFAVLASGVHNPLAAVMYKAEVAVPVVASTAARTAASAPAPVAAAAIAPLPLPPAPKDAPASPSPPPPPPPLALPPPVIADRPASVLTSDEGALLNTMWRLVREHAHPKQTSWTGGVIEGGDPAHPKGGCAFDQLEPDPVSACGQLCLTYRDAGCRFFYINIEGGRTVALRFQRAAAASNRGMRVKATPP